MLTRLLLNFSLNCTDPESVCDGNVIAYTLTSTTDIYFCDIFDEVETTELCGSVTVADRSICGGTVLHEMTRALSGTADVTYGCDADKDLSDSERIGNADNFNGSFYHVFFFLPPVTEKLNLRDFFAF